MTLAALSDRYRVERELGAGGMATVYLAEDIRHGRRVAIKVLRPDLAAVIGADRFVREIRTIANLQHPHILGLIDSGEVSGTAYYVMPYVDGESLRNRLERETQLPVHEAVRIATEVAGALDYAHRQGVIHRDIKPENILLHDGRALVADFGIALAVHGAADTRMTETGMSLGTPHYMSPEQAMGERQITARSDVYALGAVLHEMLIGEPPFTGPTAQAIVARVVTEEPRPLAPRRRSIPPHVEAVVMTALEKLPADRFPGAAEFAEALHDENSSSLRGRKPEQSGRSATRSPRTLRVITMTAVAALLGALATGAMAFAFRPDAVPAPVIRYQVPLPNGAEAALVMPSPDGARLAIVQVPGPEAPTLWVKERDEPAPVQRAGTEGVFVMGWSPDGRSFVSSRPGDGLRKFSLTSEGSVVLADDSFGPGVAWLESGTIVYVRVGSRSLGSVSENGGPASIVHTDSAEIVWPTPITGRDAVLFSRCPRGCGANIELWGLDLETGRSRHILDAVRGWYLPGGYLVYVRSDGTVHAAPFDAGRLDTTGAAVPVLDPIFIVDRIFPLLEISPSGTIAYRTGAPLELNARFEFVWVDRQGGATPVDSGWTVELTRYGGNFGWALSPDGQRVAIGVSTTEGDDIWIKQLPDGPFSRMTFDSASEYRPRWLPDGRVMFGSNRGPTTLDSLAGGLYARRADGTGRDSLMVRSDGGIYEGQLSPDGRWLVFRTGGRRAEAGGRDIYGIRPGIDTVPVPLIATRYDEHALAIAPGGGWIAYESDEAGRMEVFLRPFPATDAGKWQVSNGGGRAPLWSRDGRELFYVDAQRRMVAVPVSGGDGVEPRLGPRTPLFRLDDVIYLGENEVYTPHDVAADGRFLMARLPQSPGEVLAESSPLVVAENWVREMKARMAEAGR